MMSAARSITVGQALGCRHEVAHRILPPRPGFVSQALTDREVALRRGQAKTTAEFGHDVEADPWPFGVGLQCTCHVCSLLPERMASWGCADTRHGPWRPRGRWSSRALALW